MVPSQPFSAATLIVVTIYNFLWGGQHTFYSLTVLYLHTTKVGLDCTLQFLLDIEQIFYFQLSDFSDTHGCVPQRHCE